MLTQKAACGGDVALTNGVGEQQLTSQPRVWSWGIRAMGLTMMASDGDGR